MFQPHYGSVVLIRKFCRCERTGTGSPQHASQSMSANEPVAGEGMLASMLEALSAWPCCARPGRVCGSALHSQESLRSCSASQRAAANVPAPHIHLSNLGGAHCPPDPPTLRGLAAASLQGGTLFDGRRLGPRSQPMHPRTGRHGSSRRRRGAHLRHAGGEACHGLLLLPCQSRLRLWHTPDGADSAVHRPPRVSSRTGRTSWPAAWSPCCRRWARAGCPGTSWRWCSSGRRPQQPPCPWRPRVGQRTWPASGPPWTLQTSSLPAWAAPTLQARALRPAMRSQGQQGSRCSGLAGHAAPQRLRAARQGAQSSAVDSRRDQLACAEGLAEALQLLQAGRPQPRSSQLVVIMASDAARITVPWHPEGRGKVGAPPSLCHSSGLTAPPA